MTTPFSGYVSLPPVTTHTSLYQHFPLDHSYLRQHNICRYSHIRTQSNTSAPPQPQPTISSDEGQYSGVPRSASGLRGRGRRRAGGRGRRGASDSLHGAHASNDGDWISTDDDARNPHPEVNVIGPDCPFVPKPYTVGEDIPMRIPFLMVMVLMISRLVAYRVIAYSYSSFTLKFHC